MDNIKIVDYNGHLISLGDVVKRLNTATNETTYFLYAKASDYNKNLLYHLSSKGDIEKNSLQHIPIDLSVTLYNSEDCKWHRVGKRSELRNDTFK